MSSGIGLAATFLAVAPVQAQAVPQKAPAAQTVVPGTRFNPPPGTVVDDPNRVFGDEAPFFAPLSVVGALGLRPSASLTIVHDDNVARIEDDDPLPSRFRSKADWSFRPEFGLSAERNVGRQRLFANMSVGRIIYAQNSNLNTNRFSVGGGAGLSLGRLCGGQVTGGFTKRDWLIGSFEEAANATVEATTFGASVSCSTSAGLSGSVNYSRGYQRNISRDDSIDRSFANSDFQSVGGSLSYRLGLRGQVGVNGSWSENIFPNQLVLGEENRNTITSYALFGSYRIGNTLNASGSIGQSRVKSNTPGSEPFEGGVWNIGIGYAGPRIGANLNMGQSVNGGGGNQAANFAVSRTFTASATYELNNALSLSAGYNRFDQDFRGTSLIPETVQVQNFKGDRAFIGANYALARFMSVRADLSRQSRRSQPDGDGFKSTIFSLALSANF